jgi:hypothetical protein
MQTASEVQTPASIRWRLTTATVAGTAFALSAVAGVPALADGHGSGSAHGGSHHQSSSHPSQSHSQRPASRDAGGHGAPATGTGTGSSGHGTPATGTGTGSGGHNPPGNNGTVFIHDVAGDHSPHNVPHVTCAFYADFFGFDNGQTVTVSFAGQAPTGAGTALGGTWTGVISTDDAGGAGNDFDHELAFTADQLGVSALGAPAKQGYHVKMTVATGEPGGKKSKVFWIEPCAAVAGGTTGGAVLGDTFGGVLGGTSGGAVLGTSAGRVTGATSTGRSAGATVLGERFSRTTGAAAVAGNATGLAVLPFTGSEVRLMAAAAIAAIGTGLVFVTAGQRRRTAMPG